MKHMKKKPLRKKATSESTRLDELPPLYDGWVRDLAKRFDHKLRERRVTRNTEGGDEFEIAICEQLREILPTGIGVCRGYIVDMYGGKAGDDVIVYDAAHVPTLRGLGGDLHKKDYVPAESVLAYIEAKQTLYIKPKQNQTGQSIAKACSQVANIKALKRAYTSRFDLNTKLREQFGIKTPPGYPERGNPWYASIFATRVALTSGEILGKQRPTTMSIDACVAPLPDDHLARPDTLVCPQLFVAPVFLDKEANIRHLRPFTTESTMTLASESSGIGFGLGFVHLLWAIGQIKLGTAQWLHAMHQELIASEKCGHTPRLYTHATPSVAPSEPTTEPDRDHGE
ncbi:MAG: hypothetical protein K1X67_15070 [Fimbriimonadaceae bacterium]|nr:hypothetical protein [Fimbriimonadaceae bacterium]